MRFKGIDPKKELFIWGPLSFRLFYGAMFNTTLWGKMHRYYPWNWPPVLEVFRNGEVSFIVDNDDLRDVGTTYFTHYFLNPSMYKNHWKLWQQWLATFWEIDSQLDALPYRTLSHDQLGQLFDSYYQFNSDFWLIVQVPEIANWGGEAMLLQELKHIDTDRAQEYLEILSAPTKPSFFQVEELELLAIGLISNESKRKHALKEHARHYRWLLNSYAGDRILSQSYFTAALKKLLRHGTPLECMRTIERSIKDNQKRQTALVNDLGLSKRIQFMAEQLRQSIWWQDLRKSYIWRMQYYWDKILEQVARRHDWSMDDLLNCWPEEVRAILSNKKVDRQTIRSRSKQYAVYMSKQGYRHCYGVQAAAITKIYGRKLLDKTITHVKGLVVSKTKNPITRGRAIIVRDPFKDGRAIKKGDILVATMTSPEFVVIMKKATAIVTDEGGMTAHAAVVSRELGIPCVCATRVATQVFRTGDRIEVDTNSGSVRKIR